MECTQCTVADLVNLEILMCRFIYFFPRTIDWLKSRCDFSRPRFSLVDYTALQRQTAVSMTLGEIQMTKN